MNIFLIFFFRKQYTFAVFVWEAKMHGDINFCIGLRMFLFIFSWKASDTDFKWVDTFLSSPSQLGFCERIKPLQNEALMS